MSMASQPEYDVTTKTPTVVRDMASGGRYRWRRWEGGAWDMSSDHGCYWSLIRGEEVPPKVKELAG